MSQFHRHGKACGMRSDAAPIPNTPVTTTIAAVLAAAAALWLAWRIWQGFYFQNFGDEVGHLVGAWVINSGGRLYRDFVDNHGPVPYALAQAYGALAGWGHPNRARIIPVCLAGCSLTAVAFSPLLRGTWQRLVAAGTCTGLFATIWLVQGLCLYDYQPLAGMLLLTAIALFAAPFGAGITPRPAFSAVGGASCVFACFTAYAYGPAALLLFGSAIWAGWRLPPPARASLRAAAAGSLAALCLMALWLAIFADPRGYLAFHFIAPQLHFSRYLHFSPLVIFNVLIPSYQRWAIVQNIGTAAATLAILLFAIPLLRHRGWRHAGPLIPGALALTLCNPRGSVIFQNAAFLIASFGLLSLALARVSHTAASGHALPRAAVMAGAVVLVGATEFACRHALSSPDNFTRKALVHLQPHALGVTGAPWAEAVRRATKPSERFLALPFDPARYFLAGRLPMRRYYIYLPWDADYGRHPWFGVTHDLCTDLPRDPPPVIYYNGWVVWDRYDPRRYMPCVLATIAQLYVPAPGAPDFYVRRDRLDLWNGRGSYTNP